MQDRTKHLSKPRVVEILNIVEVKMKFRHCGTNLASKKLIQEYKHSVITMYIKNFIKPTYKFIITSVLSSWSSVCGLK